MINTGLYPHTVTRVRPSTSVDGYNNTVLDYDTPASTASVQGRLIAKTTDRLFDALTPARGRDAEVETWEFLTNESDILADDRLQWTHPARGLIDFEVEGQPMPRYRRDSYSHTKVMLRIVEG